MNYMLTIAASDNSGGAGIQQDIKVAHDLGWWPLSSITGITVQDFSRVYRTQPVNPDLLKQQITQCLESFPVKSVKIGAVCHPDNLIVIAECLEKYHPEHVVLDPVLKSGNGTNLFDLSSIELYSNLLFPLTEIITPNKQEFELLSQCKISCLNEAIEIARKKSQQWKTAILLKGGHFEHPTIQEAIVTGDKIQRFERCRNNFDYQHGTGCTLSSALSCFLGSDNCLENAYNSASEYLVNLFSNLNNQRNKN